MTKAKKNGLKVTREPKHAVNQQETLWRVGTDVRVQGFVTKFRNTRTETHPYKVFKGIGKGAEFLGVVYGSFDEALALLTAAL